MSERRAAPGDPLHLVEYAVDASVALTEAERRPTLSAAGRRRLAALLTDPDAPAWTHRAGDRLTAAAVERAAVDQPPGDWLPGHLERVRTSVPAYRGYPGPLAELADFPLVDREDLVADVAAFVPRDADLDAMVHGSSSGSTGHALAIPDELTDVARTFTLLRRLVEDAGVDWRPDPDRLALAYLVRQRQAYTYAATVSTFAEALMARVNLGAADWPAAAQLRFWARCRPQVLTGDPSALAALLQPGPRSVLAPLALVSGASELTPALRADLATAYGCPVLDLYGLHETRPIAVSPDGGPHRVLDRRVLVEVLDPAGRPVPAGERGEIVVTAGENPLLPLVRYRTGDHGRLVVFDGRPAIADLEGRATVDLVAADGRRVPSVDLTQLLQAAGAYGWTVRQRADGRLDVVLAAPDGDPGRVARVEAGLVALLGRPVTVRQVDDLATLGPGKPRRYARDGGETS
jgi:phenylacetate-CoA ligase